jgi:hypothetical protein
MMHTAAWLPVKGPELKASMIKNGKDNWDMTLPLVVIFHVGQNRLAASVDTDLESE